MDKLSVAASIEVEELIAQPPPAAIDGQVVEVISDSGEGAQKCGQSFATVAAKMGIGIWTVEIIPAEIEPPARSIAGASGNRVRLGAGRVTNGGDQADLAVALNEQVLLGRVRAGALRRGATILLESKWRHHRDPAIVSAYSETYQHLIKAGYRVIEVPMEQVCLEYTRTPQRGKNMFVLGMLVRIYSLDPEIARAQIGITFQRKGEEVVARNVELFDAGRHWAAEHLDLHYRIPATPVREPQIVVNGNTALALGVMASGMEICAMYPITPATSASHYLSEAFERVGGMVHQAEDEIAAVAFAVGASYAGKCALTISSGPGISLKQEVIGLATMAEIPLVVINVQRGGPSTGLPTKTEQGDLLQAIYGTHGDAPRVVMAAATIEDCFYLPITARRIAETFNMPVILLTDANLATAQTPFRRPRTRPDWFATPIDQSTVPEGEQAYDWDRHTGLHRRVIPGQPGGMYTVTGLAHTRASKVAYDPGVNEEGLLNRSRKLAAFQRTLRAPPVNGDAEGGDLLVVGWGSTRGVIEEAVARLRAEGLGVSSLHLTYLQPMASGIGEIMRRFRKVVAVEMNWADRIDNVTFSEDNRRFSNLALLLRARYLVDIDCWTEVQGQPLKPATVATALRARLEEASADV